MYLKLTLGERLKDLRTERGLTLEQLAQETGISKSALGNYEGDAEREITPSNIVILAKFYGVSADYFLGLIETKNHPAPEQGALGLNDKAVAAMQNERINKRLLSELLSHPSFPRLLVDMEIYVDQIASVRIRQLNDHIDMVRKEVEERHAPVEPDLHLESLKLGHIDEHEYFTKTIYEDLFVVLRAIRKDHETDVTTADTVSDLDEFKNNIMSALSSDGSEVEKLLRTFCMQCGVNYNTMTEEEKGDIYHFLSRSKKFDITSLDRKGSRKANRPFPKKRKNH